MTVGDVDGYDLRCVMGQFPTGVAILTSGEEKPHGITINSFTSVSLEPPMILVCLNNDSRSIDKVCREQLFAISILGERQSEVARYFASRGRPQGESEFDGFRTHAADLSGAPLFSEAMAWMECSIRSTLPGGDHTVVVADVLRCASGPAKAPLLFFEGRFPEHDLESEVDEMRNIA